ncbi:lactate utilization protein [Lutispora saccharofermentans]|uniref:Lactate utilization protein n=1 Tax=Lutispora saccharofermentans TaxID=3024236 RepID=A0ABT1NKL5_9FIRM|nr:lactate utilization protein [Lutispora saccharofermentans]MCQ1531807.1 lactate utilization protein [Lutispora saccharofermentans]
MDDNMKSEMIKNFKSRNIEVSFFETLEEAKDRMIELIPPDSSVGVGNSKTLKDMNISKLLKERGNIVFDKTLAENKAESEQVKKKSLLADWYITGTNAVSKEGHIVNIDHSGNRAAAMIYGPDNVIIVIGRNKICGTLDDAVKRARNISAPMNAKRAGYNPPCLQLNRCIDCKSDERVCFNLVIIEGQFVKDRMKLFIVDEEAGF